MAPIYMKQSNVLTDQILPNPQAGDDKNKDRIDDQGMEEYSYFAEAFF